MANTNYTAKVNEELERLKSLLNYIREANEDTANAYKEQLEHAQNLLAIHKQDRGSQLVLEAKAQKELNEAERERVKIIKELNGALEEGNKAKLDALKQEYKLRNELREKNKQDKLELSNDSYIKQISKRAEITKANEEALKKSHEFKLELENLKHKNKLEEDHLKILDRASRLKTRLKAVDSIGLSKRQIKDYVVKAGWKLVAGENSPFEINKRETKRKEHINASYKKNLQNGIDITEASEIRDKLLGEANENISK